MKNCFSYQDDLKAYADGELSPLRRWAVRRHLTHCASCQEEMKLMTQLTNDLRASESDEALSPALREKLLAEPTPAQVPTLPKREGKEFQDDSTFQAPRPPAPGGPLRSKEAGSSKRRLPAWTYAAAAVVAWFVFYPTFQVMHMQQQAQMASPTAPVAHERQIKVFKPLPQQTAGVPTSSDGPMPPERSIPAPVSAHFAAPMEAKPPPPPPKPKMMARVSGPVATTGDRIVYSTFGLEKPDAASMNGNANDLNGDPDSLRQVHKEAGIGLQVPDPDATGDKLNDMVKETGGYVAANNLSTESDGRKSGELIVKVPEAQFETFLAAVAKLGTVVSKNITGQDITEQTSDAHEAQSVEESDLEQAEARLKALGSHAKWEDKEDTQDQRVRLAQTRARLKMLKRMAALGTVTIDLSQTPKAAGAVVPAASGFTGLMKTTTHDALESLSGSAAALFALVIWLLAYSPIWVPLLLLGRYALKEYRKRKAVQ